MAKLLKLRRGTTSDHNSFTGAEGEVTVDTTKDTLVVHDGSTQGGHPLAKASEAVATTGATFTGNVLIDNAQELRLGEADASGTNFTALKAQPQSGDITLTLPAVAPTANQVLKADGSTPTTLTWASDVALTSIDEDDMSSNSASAVPTQQSVKAYVDTQVATKQASDAELTELATMASGTAGALADLTQTEVEILDGATVTTAELNKLDGFTGDKDDLIYAKDLKATGVTDTEFDYLDGVTSNIQTQLNAKGTSNVALSDDNVWSGAQRGTVTTATHSSGATYDFDLNVTNCFKLTISAGVELGFSNMTAGTAGTIEIVNSGSTVPTWATEVYFAGGTSKAPTITASATTVLAYYCFDSSKVLVEGMSDVKNTA